MKSKFHYAGNQLKIHPVLKDPHPFLVKFYDQRVKVAADSYTYLRTNFANMQDGGFFQNIIFSEQLPYLDCRIPGEKKFEEEDYSRLDLPLILPTSSIDSRINYTPFLTIYFPIFEHFIFGPPLPEDLVRHSLLALHDVANMNAVYESYRTAEEDDAQAEAENYDYVSPLFINEDHKYIFNKIFGIDYNKAYRLKGSSGAYKFYYRMNIPLNIDTLNDDPLWSNGEFMFGSPEYYFNYFNYMEANRPEQLLDYYSDEFEDKDFHDYYRGAIFGQKFDKVKASRYNALQHEIKRKNIREVTRRLKLYAQLGQIHKLIINPPFKCLNSFEILDITEEKIKKFKLYNYIKKQNLWNFYNEDFNRLYGFLFIKDNDFSMSKIYTKYIPKNVRLHSNSSFSLFSFPSNTRPKTLYYFFKNNKGLPSPYYCRKGFFDLPIIVMLYTDLNEYEMKLVSLCKSNFFDLLTNNSNLNINTRRFRKINNHV